MQGQGMRSRDTRGGKRSRVGEETRGIGVGEGVRGAGSVLAVTCTKGAPYSTIQPEEREEHSLALVELSHCSRETWQSGSSSALLYPEL